MGSQMSASTEARGMTLEGHEDRAWCVAWAPSGTALASSSGDHTVKVWCARTGRCLETLREGHQRTVRSVAFHPSGRTLAAASFDGTTSVWTRERETGWEPAAHLEGHENEVKGVAFSAGGELVATCSRDKSVWVWGLEDEAEAEADALDFECLAVLQDHTADVKCVRWHPRRNVLASGSYDDTVIVWARGGGGEADDEDEDEEWGVQLTLGGHESTVWSVDWSADGEMLASASGDGTLRVWDLRAKKCVQVLGPFGATLYSVSWSHAAAGDGTEEQRLACGGADDRIRIFACTEGEWRLQREIADAHAGDVNCVCWHPSDGRLLASAGDDGLVKVWDV